MIKVQDIAYVRFTAPDLDTMQQFGEDFGLVVSARSDDRLHLRGTDPTPWCHATERGEPGFVGAGFLAASYEDLVAASKLDGASVIQKIDGPGGGRCVRFRDPDGVEIDVVYGREQPEALPVPIASGVNRGSERQRLGRVHRPPAGPSSVKRLGHVVFRVSDFRRSTEWYRSRFGFVPSDEVYIGDPENVVTAFMRCDRGREYSDHHSLLCVGLGEPGFDHAAFEVEDVDALMAGHDFLESRGYAHHAGVGRHVLGSQIFDYWKDPWGHVVEHFTDGDLLNADHEPGSYDPGTALGTLWGDFTAG